jgi:hypothetical protein
MLRRFFGVLGKLCLLLLPVWLLANGAYAQMETATISGQVVDPTGLSVTGAQVKLVDIDRDAISTTTTSNSGLYTFPSVKPGRYRMEVAAAGFRVVNVTGLTVNVQDHLEQNFKLLVGSVSESVTVEAGALQVNTTDASVSTVIDRKFVENIPLNGRSFQDLVSMTPGVVTQSPQAGSFAGNNGDFSVNGQRTESNYFTVDGVSGNIGPGTGTGIPQNGTSGSLAASTALGTTQSLVSVDALQEFRVQSSSYSANYGRTPGGQFSLVTRSGTNDLHGTAFDYLRNNFFDANDWFNDALGVPEPPLRQNDFGGTLGGPIRIPGLYNGKNKSFFFASYEGLRLTQPQAATIRYVPDAFMRQQAPAALQPILNAFPLPTPGRIDYGTASSPSLAQFIEGYSLPSQIDSTSVRIDHTFGPKLSLFFRFGDTPSSTTGRLLSETIGTDAGAQTYTLGATSQFSSKANNEIRIGYARSNSVLNGTLDGFGGAKPINFAAALGAQPSATPELIFDVHIPGVGSAPLIEEKTANQLRQWNIVDTFSLSLGHHQVTLGVDYRRIKSPIAAPDPVVEPFFFSTQSVLSNAPTFTILGHNIGATPIFNETATFAEDEWHATPSLVLSFGLRWEVDPPPTEAHGKDAYTLLGSLSNPSTLTQAPRGTPLWKTTWYNFAPRLGVAWQFRSSAGWQTVLRMGGGVFFDTDNQEAAQGFGGTGFAANNQLFQSPLPVTQAQLNFSPSTNPPYNNAVAFPPHLQLPYTLQWNASVEQGMGRSQAFTISYVGSNGRRLIQQQQLSLTALNPNFGTVTYFPAGVTSSYEALQLKFQRTLAHGVQALASYTWSHSIDFGSNDAAQPLLRGNSDFDVRHNFQSGLSWDLPGPHGSLFAKAILNHWGLDSRLMARTGFPITLLGNQLVDPVTGNTFFGNVDLVPGQAIYLYGSQYPGGRALNPAAFVIPANPNDPGNAPRNFVRGFGAWQINMAIRREFPIHERLRLQFRAEAFNILNHPNFGFVDPVVGNPTFGQATQMLNQSLATVSSLYQQGGPRSMQFALKLTF